MKRINRILRPNEVQPYCGVRATQRAELEAEGEFPKRVILRDGGRAIGWYEDEVADWQEYRRAKRDKIFTGNYQQWLASKQSAAA